MSCIDQVDVLLLDLPELQVNERRDDDEANCKGEERKAGLSCIDLVDELLLDLTESDHRRDDEKTL